MGQKMGAGLSRMDIIEAWRLSRNQLEEQGWRLTEEIADKSFLAEMRSINKKASGLFRLDTSDITTKNSFWLALRKDQDLIGTVAARLDDVDNRGLAEFLERTLSRYWQTDGSTRVKVRLPPTLHNFRGQLIYAGDFFFHKEHTGDFEKSFCFTQAAFAFAFNAWPNAKALCAFIRMSDYFDGKAAQYGFSSGVFFDVATWKNPPSYRSEHECLCWLTREDFEFNMSALLAYPHLFSELPKRRSRDQSPASKRPASQ